ncbi:hypothetical protein [Oenococcus kitaharae]|nr:hypothetical protein [Oenococcus kitaharae]MCV3296403.1 hypothetical protein [Oenococcus kitaharae]
MAKKKKEKFESIKTAEMGESDPLMDSLFAKIKLNEDKKQSQDKAKQA